MTLSLHPLAGSSFTNWLELLRDNQGIDNQYISKGILISLGSISGIMKSYFRQFVLFNNLSQEMQLKWREAYLRILKKASYQMKSTILLC